MHALDCRLCLFRQNRFGGLAGLQKIRQKRCVVKRAELGAMKFGVPLHRGHVGGAGVPDSLDHAVVRTASLNLEARRQVFDALMMNAIDLIARNAP